MNWKSWGIITLSILIMVFTQCPAFAGEPKTVVAATLSDYQPYCFLIEGASRHAVETIPPNTDSTQLQGYSWDVVRESLHEMGYTIKLLIVPWERGMSYIRHGIVDVLFPTARTIERQKTFHYSQEIVNEAKYLIYIPAGCRLQWNGLESLHGRRIAVIRGWSYGQAWKIDEHILKEPCDDILQSFQMLEKKRVFGVAGYDIVFDYVLKKSGMSASYHKLPPFDRNDEYMAGSKHRPNVLKILQDFDEGKRRIIRNGDFEAISAKWR